MRLPFGKTIENRGPLVSDQISRRIGGAGIYGFAQNAGDGRNVGRASLAAFHLDGGYAVVE